MSTSKLLLLAVTTLLGGCAAEHADIPSDPAAPAPARSGVERDLRVAVDVAPPAPRPAADVALPAPRPEVRVFAAGGDDERGSARTEVFSAAIREDGSLSAWRAEASLPVAMGSLSLTRAGAALVAIGGGSVLASVNKGDAIARWRAVRDIGVSSGAAVTTDGSSLLVLGGSREGKLLDLGLVSSVAAGVPGDFTPSAALPSARAALGAGRLGRNVFAVGGATETGATDEVLSGRLQADGSVEVWRPAPSLPRPLSNHAVAASGDHLLVLGGRADDGPSRDVLAARASDDGELAAWASVSTMPAGVQGHCVVASGANLIAIGGQTAGARATADVLTATVDMDGTVGQWRQLESLPGARAHLGCAVR